MLIQKSDNLQTWLLISETKEESKGDTIPYDIPGFPESEVYEDQHFKHYIFNDEEIVYCSYYRQHCTNFVPCKPISEYENFVIYNSRCTYYYVFVENVFPPRDRDWETFKI